MLNKKISITKDDYNTNDFLHCWSEFKTRPNKMLIHNTYHSESFNNLLESYIIDKNIFTEIIPNNEGDIINDKLLVKIDKSCYISYIISDRNNDDSTIDGITFYYSDYDQIQKIVDLLDECLVDLNIDENNILNTISSSINGLDIDPISLNDSYLDNIKLFYNKETFKELNKLIKRIDKSNKGLSIFVGERGVGKTSILNYIASKVNRIIIYIPNNMIDQTINSHEFKNFIIKYDRPIIVIDDCESFNDYQINSVVNNTLQLVDGFLSDNTNVNVIMIYNEDNDSIDSLSKCNNLIGIVEFNYLDIKESNTLSKHLKQNKKYKNNSKLVDIRNKKYKNTEFNIGF